MNEYFKKNQEFFFAINYFNLMQAKKTLLFIPKNIHITFTFNYIASALIYNYF
jgi:hypothetical protein